MIMGKNVAVSTFWISLHTHVYNMEFFDFEITSHIAQADLESAL